LQQQLEARPGGQAANEELRQSCEARLDNITEELSEAFRKVTRNKFNFENVVEQAHKLALEFGIQRSRLQLFAPQLNEEVPRKTKTYTDVNNGNAHTVDKGVVQLVVAPGLRRTGDGRGYTFHEAIDIWPAAVYLIPS
jgi:regulator of replication initiation timing